MRGGGRYQLSFSSMYFIYPILLSVFTVLSPQGTTLHIAHADTIRTFRSEGSITRTHSHTHVAPAPVITPTPTPPVQTPPVVTLPPTTSPNNPPSDTPTSFAAQVEQEVFARINTERAKNGLAQLALDSTLTTLARAHSTDMVTNSYFSHTDLSGCDGACRFTNAGYAYSWMGENIYTMTGYSLTPAATADMVVSGWMNSPGHRANILNTHFTNQGIGVAVQGSTVDVTQDLSLPR